MTTRPAELQPFSFCSASPLRAETAFPAQVLACHVDRSGSTVFFYTPPGALQACCEASVHSQRDRSLSPKGGLLHPWISPSLFTLSCRHRIHVTRSPRQSSRSSEDFPYLRIAASRPGRQTESRTRSAKQRRKPIRLMITDNREKLAVVNVNQAHTPINPLSQSDLRRLMRRYLLANPHVRLQLLSTLLKWRQ